MGFFGELFKSSFDRFIDSTLDEELAYEYEKRRLEWIDNGAGDRTYEMRRIDNEMVRRSNEKYKKEHPNAKSVHREHGWYLSSDDD